MENEENRGFIDTNAFEDQLASFLSGLFNVTLCPLSFGDLSLFSISLTLRHLELSWSTLALDQERKRRKEERRIKKRRAGSNNYNRIICRYQFPCVGSFLYLEYMVLHVCSWFSLFHWRGFF